MTKRRSICDVETKSDRTDFVKKVKASSAMRREILAKNAKAIQGCKRNKYYPGPSKLNGFDPCENDPDLPPTHGLETLESLLPVLDDFAQAPGGMDYSPRRRNLVGAIVPADTTPWFLDGEAPWKNVPRRRPYPKNTDVVQLTKASSVF
jgi:hypothetical protein